MVEQIAVTADESSYMVSWTICNYGKALPSTNRASRNMWNENAGGDSFWSPPEIDLKKWLVSSLI